MKGEVAELLFMTNDTSMLTIQIKGGKSSSNCTVFVGEDSYVYSLSNLETYTLSSEDLADINSAAIWKNDITLTVRCGDFSYFQGCMLEQGTSSDPYMRELLPEITLTDFSDEFEVELGSSTFYSYTLPTVNGVDWENAAAIVRPRVKLSGETKWHYTEWYNEDEGEDYYMPYIYGIEYENQYIYYDDNDNVYKLAFTLDVEPSSYLTINDTVELLVDLATVDGIPAHAVISLDLKARTYIAYRIQLLKANGDLFEYGDTMPTATLDNKSIGIKDRTSKNESYYIIENVSTDNAELIVNYDNTSTNIYLPVTTFLTNHEYTKSFTMNLDGSTHIVPSEE